MKYLLLPIIAVFLMAASCERCYNCSCETYTEVNGQIVDTNTTVTPVCGTQEDIEPYESDGCICAAQ